MAFILRSKLETNREENGIVTTIVNHKRNGSAMMTVLDSTVPAGAEVAPHHCINTEESMLVYQGRIQFVRNGETIQLETGDCIYFPPKSVRSFTNNGDGEARIISFAPHPEPEIEFAPHPEEAAATNGAMVYRRDEPYEFKPGVFRCDVTSADIGATSSMMSDVVVNPGYEIPLHYHPKHDESMYCLEGDLVFTYGEEKNIHGTAGDVFLGELKIPHGVRNENIKPARFLAIHPTTEPLRVFV